MRAASQSSTLGYSRMDGVCLLAVCSLILALRSLFLQLTHVVTEKGSFVVCSLIFSFGDASLRRDDGRVGPVVERWETDPANYSYQ